MRACLVTTSYPQWKGDMAGHFIESLANHLTDGQGLDVTVLCPASQDWIGYGANGSVRVKHVRYFWPAGLQKLTGGAGIPWNLRHSLVAWLNVPAFLVAFFVRLCRLTGRADVIHAHWGVLGAVAVLSRPIHRCKVVLTVHGSDLRSTIAPIRWMTQWAIRHADAVTTPSREFWTMCRRARGSGSGCFLVPNGVHMPSCEQVKLARQQHGAEGREISIVSVGRLIPQRRHDLLVRAFQGVRRRFPSARLTIVGLGPQYKALKNLAAELDLTDAVAMPGQVPTFEVSRYLLGADLYVSPTTVENFGTAVVEAAACALPIVTTAVGFPAELVAEGQGGLVVPAEDGDALQAAMIEVLQSPQRHQMGWRMRERVEQLGLTWPQCAARMMEIYRAIP